MENTVSLEKGTSVACVVARVRNTPTAVLREDARSLYELIDSGITGQNVLSSYNVMRSELGARNQVANAALLRKG